MMINLFIIKKYQLYNIGLSIYVQYCYTYLILSMNNVECPVMRIRASRWKGTIVSIYTEYLFINFYT
jgi:hypothetical protein